MGKLPPVPPRDGDADDGERGGLKVDPGDAGPCERGEYADLHAGEHPGAGGGACLNASGGAGRNSGAAGEPVKLADFPCEATGDGAGRPPPSMTAACPCQRRARGSMAAPRREQYRI